MMDITMALGGGCARGAAISQAFWIFADSVVIASRGMAELRLQLDVPEVIIRPDVPGINLLDKVDVAEVVLRREQAVEALLPDLVRISSFPARTWRQFQKTVRIG